MPRVGRMAGLILVFAGLLAGCDRAEVVRGGARIPRSSGPPAASEFTEGMNYDPLDEPLAWPTPDTLYVAHLEHYSDHDVSSATCDGSGFYAVAVSRQAILPVGTGRPACYGVNWMRLSASMSRSGRFAISEGYAETNRSELIRVNLPSGPVEPIRSGCAVYVEEPDLSPDGRMIVFSGICRDRSQEHYELHVVGADGTGLRRIPVEPGAEAGSPRWSPDGRLIAYVQSIPARNAVPSVVVTNVAGTERRIVARGYAPAWSADGKWIAYLPDDGSNRELGTIHVVRSDGSGDRRVFRNRRWWSYYRGWGPVREGMPGSRLVWSPNSRWIAFSRRFDRGASVWRVDVHTGELRRVTRRDP